MTQRLLEDRLRYHFHDPNMLTMALTHRSRGGGHNERLEFLGDAVINMVVAEVLYAKFSDAAEGALSRWRASLVNRDALTTLAKQFDLGPHILLGPGEKQSGGHERHSILSCTMEAVIGAIYLDGGFASVRACIAEWIQPLVDSLSHATHHKDAKTLLQEYAQAKHLALPVYAVEKVTGAAHQQHFTIRCSIAGTAFQSFGEGASRRKGEQHAANEMLKQLKG